MTTKTAFQLNPHADESAPYSSGIRVGDLVFVAGQGPVNQATGKFEIGDFEHEVNLTLQNVAAVLAAADCTLDDVVKVSVHLQNINDFERFNAIYRTYFSHPRPARTTVQSVLMLGISVEVDAIAVRGCSGR